MEVRCMTGPPPRAISASTSAPIESLHVGGWRSLAARTVRDREAPGSNPGPPTNFVFKTGDFARRQERTGHSRVTDSPRTPLSGQQDIDRRLSIRTRAILIGRRLRGLDEA